MHIEYFHASKYGNGEQVANEFKRVMAAHDVTVNFHHMKDIRPKDIPAADIYVFSSPGRFGRPLMRTSRFLKALKLPAGTRYAILNTQAAAQADAKGKVPTAEEMAKWHRMIPIMSKILNDKNLTLTASGAIDVLNLKGPMEEGWQQKTAAFAEKLIENK